MQSPNFVAAVMGITNGTYQTTLEAIAEATRGKVVPNSVKVVAISLEQDGSAVNLTVNADVAATEVARQLHAHKLIFVSEVNGVRADPNDANSMIESLTAEQARKLLNSGAIVGGMIPKIQSCLKTIESGVEKIHIINGRLRHAILLEIFTSQGVGTEIVESRR